MSKFNMKDLLNDQSKKQPGASAGSGFAVRDIPISRIKPSPNNRYSLSDIEALAASIEEIGLLHPVVVKEPDGDGYFELISGERRFRACKLLFESGNAQYENVPGSVLSPRSPAEEKLILFHANAMARILSDYEKTIQAAEIKNALQEMKANGHKFKGRMREIVADVLNVSPAQMGRMESIHKNLLPEIAELFKAEEIGITAAYDLSALSPDKQRAALERYKETGSFEKPKPQPTQPKAMPMPPPADTPESYTQKQPQETRGGFMESMGRQTTTPPQPPASPAPDTSSDTKAREMTAPSPAAAPPVQPPRTEQEKHVERDAPPLACVSLVDKDGDMTSYSGNLALIAAVDTETDIFAGAFSTADGVTGLDYATLAKAVCVECFKRLEGDEISVDIMRVNLAGLFARGLDT